MQIERIPDPDGSDAAKSTTEEDVQAQRAVLAVVLDQHPAVLTSLELIRELGSEEADRFTRAIRDLGGAGLLRGESESVLPTRAALHFDSLRP